MKCIAIHDEFYVKTNKRYDIHLNTMNQRVALSGNQNGYHTKECLISLFLFSYRVCAKCEKAKMNQWIHQKCFFFFTSQNWCLKTCVIPTRGWKDVLSSCASGNKLLNLPHTDTNTHILPI